MMEISFESLRQNMAAITSSAAWLAVKVYKDDWFVLEKVPSGFCKKENFF